MKKSFLFLFALVIMLGSCRHEADTLVGTWTVDKVHVQFDEQRVTPELVKQVGEMERQNTFSISADSVMVFKGLDLTWEGHVCLKSDTTLLCDGREFGTWCEGRIVTQVDTPVGEVIVIYRKE